MPTPYKQQIEDRLWTLLEGYAPLASTMKLANRLKQSGDGWLRERIQRMPNDFPRIEITNGKYTHSGYKGQKPTYAMESPTFAGHWIVNRTVQFLVVLTARGMTSAELTPLEEESQDALLKSGPRLGLDFVSEWGPITATSVKQVSINGTDHLQSAMIVPVTMEFDGYELITP